MSNKKSNVVTVCLNDKQVELLKQYMEKRFITTKSRALVDALVFAFSFNNDYSYNFSKDNQSQSLNH